MDESLGSESYVPGTATAEVRDENTFKILIASDIHLGYNDNNVCRENDSFETFEEILKIGRDEMVDFVLLGGDLFHENKPKPSTLHRTMEIMRKYCLGSKAIEFDYLGDPSVDFPHQETPEVNYQNPDVNIALPVFTIHGNHDDPVGVKKTSAVDHLVAAKLLNHFGQWDSLKEILITPVPLVKGETKLLLYGLGNIKDERLFRLFRDQKVKFVRPQENKEDWFSIFVLHQNRVKHGPKNYIPEGYLPGFLDLAIWGHEHECRIDPEHSDDGDVKTYIIQPGSSVATSLCPGEAKEKHVGILYINKKRFKVEKKKLMTVRPFVFDDIFVNKIMEGVKRTVELNVTQHVEAYVEKRVQILVRDALDLLSGHDKQPIEPLIRIRVFHETSEESFNPIRFAQKFADKVINEDIVLFKRITGKRDGLTEMEMEEMDNMILTHDVADLETHVESIVEAYFAKARENDDHAIMLEVLSERGLSEAVKTAVEKDDKDAITVIIDSQVEKVSEYLMKKEVNEDNIEELLEELRTRRLAQPEREFAEAHDLLKARIGKKGRAEANGNGFESDADEDNEVNGSKEEPEDEEDGSSVIQDDEDEEEVAPSGRARGRGRGSRGSRGRGRGGRGKKNSFDSDEEPSPPKPAASRGRGRGRAAAATAAPTSSRGRGAASRIDESPARGNFKQTTLVLRKSPRKGTTSAMVFDVSDSD